MGKEREINKDYCKRLAYLRNIKAVLSSISKVVVFIISLLSSTLILSTPALANPTGGQVISGRIVIQQNPNNTIINQATQKGIINWRSFNIGQQETTHFQQPQGGMTLNRISAVDGASQIYGRLTATGQIILINPAGIYFGPSAFVNVGSLIATTADIRNQDFIKGNYRFIQSSDYPNSTIINEGSIIAAQHGLAALVAPQVINTGTITANLGTVVLGSGNAFTVNFDGSNLVSFAIDQKSNNAKIINRGSISADGGRVLVSAKSASSVLDEVINMGGVVQANTVNVHKGEVILSATGAPIQIQGNITASGKKPNQKGGTVKVLAEKIHLKDDSLIDVTGFADGGKVLLGGNAHGSGPEPNADYVVIAPKAKIDASALTNGKGGDVVVWSNLSTNFYGTIFARGGSSSGDGGWVEVSGKQGLNFNGLVDTSAPAGKFGTLLIDPKFLIVQASGGVAYSPIINNLFNNNASGTNILTPASMAAGNIILQANTDVTFNDPLTLTGTLTVNAGRSILINANISANNKAFSFTANDNTANVNNRDAGPGNITMAAGTAIDVGGSSNLTLNIKPTSGAFTAGSMTLYDLKRGGILTLNSPNAITLNGVIGGTAALTQNSIINANTSGGTNGNVTFNNGSSILLANKALTINVNAASGGTGAVILNATSGPVISTGGETLTIATNVGGNTTGGSITQIGTNNSIITGTGDLNLTVPSQGSSSIGTSSAPIRTVMDDDLFVTATLKVGAGSGGAYILNTGDLTLAPPTLNANSPLSVIAAGGKLTLPNTPISTGTGDIYFESGNDNLSTANTLTTTNGSITLKANQFLTIADNITTSGGPITLFGNGIKLNGFSLFEFTEAVTVKAGTGNITVNAGPGTFIMGVGAKLLTGNATGSAGIINITANTLSLDNSGTPPQIGGSTVSATDIANTVIIQPTNAGTTIGLAGGSGTFSLQTSEIQDIQAKNVTIGDNRSGLITVNAFKPDTLFAIGGTLTLQSNAGITFNGTQDFTASRSSLTGVTNGPIAINANITTTNKPISLTGVGITQAANTTVTSGTAPLTYNAESGTITTNAGVKLLSTGVITLSGNGMIFATDSNSQIGGSALNVGTATNIILTEGTSGTTIGVSGGSGTLRLSQAELNIMHTTNARIGDDNSGLINIGTLTSGTTFIPNPGAGVMTLNSGGGISIAAGGGITTNNLIIRGSGAMNLTTNAANTIVNLAANITSGSLSFTNAVNNSLNIASLTDDRGNVPGIITSGATNVTLANSGTADINFNANTISGSGTISATAGRNIVLNAGNITTSGNVSLTGTTGTITEAGVGKISGALLTTNSVGGTTLNKANTVSNFNAINTTSGNISLVNTATPLTVTGITVSGGGDAIINNTGAIIIDNIINTNTGSINLQSTNSISESITGIVKGALLTTNSVGGTTLNNTNTVSSFNATNTSSGNVILKNTATPLTITGVAQMGGDVTIDNTGTIFIAGNINAGSGGVSLTSTGTVAETGAAFIHGGLLTTNSVGGTTLNNANTVSSFKATNTTNGNITLINTSDPLTIAGINQSGGGLININNAGAINQSGPIIQTSGTATFTAGATKNITLNNASNDFNTVVIASAANVILNDINTITFGASTISGNLTAKANGNITQTGILNVNGTSNFNAGIGAITLTQNNQFSGAVSLTNFGANNINLVNSTALSIDTSDIGSGTLTLTAPGISQIGHIAQEANAGAVTINAGAGAINLTNATNNFTGPVSLNNTGANAVSLRDSTALILGSSSIGTSTLAITAGGSITQTGPITQAGPGAITLALTSAGTDIDLGTAANNLSGAITFGGTLANIQDFALRNTNLGAKVPGNIGSLTNLRNVSLQFDNAGIIFPTLTLHNGGNLTAIAGGDITQSGVITVPVLGSASFAAGAHAITLDTQNNIFNGPVSLSNSGPSPNNVAVKAVSALQIAASNVGSGTLTLTGVGVSQSGPIIQAASAAAVTINAGAGAINLNSPANIFTGAVSLNNSGANNVQLTNSGVLKIGASTVGTGTLGITAGGTITQTGPIIQANGAGTVTLSVTAPNSDILLATQPNYFSGAVVYGGTLSNIRDIGRRNVYVNAGLSSTNLALLSNLRNATIIFDNSSLIGPALTLHNGGSIYIDTSGSLSGGIGGDITALGAVVVPGTTTLIAGAHNITANQDNVLTGAISISNTGNHNVSLKNTVILNMDTTHVGSGTLSLTGAGIVQTGAITQEAGAGTATFSANGGPITLTHIGNSFTGAVSLFSSGNSPVSLVNSGPLTLGASSVGTGPLSITSGGDIDQIGALVQAGPGAINLASTVVNSDIDLNTALNNLSGPITFNGTLANIHDFALRNISSSANIPTNLGSLTNLHDLSLHFDNAGITFPTLTLHAGGSLTAIAGGDITQTGILTVPGTSLFNAGAHAITLDQNNSFTGAVRLVNSGNNNVNVKNTIALSLGTSSVGTGTLSLTGFEISQIGAITQAAGAGAASITAVSGPITLTNPDNNFTGAVSLNSPGAVSLVDTGTLTLGASSIGTTLAITSGGDINQTGAILQTGIGAITFASTAADTDINLSTAANKLNGAISFTDNLATIHDFALRNISNSASVPTNIGSLTNLHDLSLQFDNVGIVFPTLTLHNDGSLKAIAGGDITQTGILTVPGTSFFDAGANAITLTQNNVLTGAVTLFNSGNHNVAIKNTIALHLDTSSVGSGTLSLTGVGITQTGGIIQAAGAGLVTIDAGNGVINLVNPNNNFTGVVSLNNTGANNVALNNIDALTLNTSNLGTGTLTLTANGPISQIGAITQAVGAGLVTIDADGNNIILTQPNNFTGAVSLNNSGTNDVLLSNNIDLTLATSSVGSGILSIIANGAIDQTGAITQEANAGTTTFSAGANAITLTQANHLTGAVSLNNSAANNVALTNNTALKLGTSSVGSGLLAIATNGDITQTGALIQAGAAGAATFSAGAHAIFLTQDNNFTGTVSLNNSGDNDVSIKDINLLTLGTSNIGSGSFTINSVGVSQTGAITQASGADTVTINAGSGAINLANATNHFTGAVSLNNSDANAVALTNNAPLVIATSSLGSGTLALTAFGTMSQTGAISQAAAGAITLTQNLFGADILLGIEPNNLTGSISFGAPLNNIRDFSLRNISSTATLPTNIGSLINLRNLTVTFDNTGIDLPTLTTTNSGNLTITVGGSITQSGPLDISGTPTFTILTPATVSDILLGDEANDFHNTPIITSNNNIRDLELRNINTGAVVPTIPTGLRNLKIVFDNAGMTLPALLLSGNLTATAGGDIIQSGILNIGAITTLSATGHNINLTNSNNNFENVTIINANDVSLTDRNALDLGASQITGTLTVNTSGDITQSGLLNVTGASSFSAGATHDITLTNSNNLFSTIAFGSANNVSVTDTNNLDLGTSIISGNLDVLTTGSISQSGNLVVNGTNKVATFNAGSTNDINLNANNDFTTVAIISGDDVTVKDINALNLATSTISGDFSVTTAGALTQTGTILANGVGTTTTLNAGSTGDITLGNLSNDFTAITTPNARNLTLTDANDLSIGAVSTVQNIDIRIAGSMLTTGLIQTDGGNVTLATTGPGTLTIGTPGIKTSLDQISDGGNIRITAANTNQLGTSVFLNGVLNTQGPQTDGDGSLTVGGGVQINAVPVTGAGDIFVSGNSNALILNDNVYTVDPEYHVIAQDIIINGFQHSTAGNLTFLADFNNDGIGGVLVTNTGRIVVDAGNLLIQSSDLIVNPGFSILIQAGLNAIQASGSISLIGNENVSNSNISINRDLVSTGLNKDIIMAPGGTGKLFYGGNITTNGGDIDFNADTTLLTNTVLTTKGGALNDGTNTFIANGNNLTFDVGSGTDISFTNIANDFDTVAVTSGRNVNLVDKDNIDLGTSTISGTLDLTAGSDITDSGPLAVAALATLAANNGGSITLDQPNNDFSTVAVTTANNIILNDVNAISLGPMTFIGNLNITAAGTINQSGSLKVIGLNRANKLATFTTSPTSDIILNDVDNELNQIIINSGNNTIINNNANLIVGKIAIAGDLDITANGNLTQTGVITIGATNNATFDVGANDIRLGNTNNVISNAIITNAHDVVLNTLTDLNFGAATLSGDLTTTVGGAITESAPLNIVGNSSFTAGGAITLTKNNNFTGAVTFNNTGNNNVAITNAGLLTIGPATSKIGSGTLNLTGAGIAQIGTIEQAANAGAVTINAGAGIINLNNTLNKFTGSVSLNNSGNNNVALTNSTDLKLAASNIGSGTFALRAGGEITQTGALTQTGPGAITLALTNPGSNINLTNALNDLSGAITFNGTLANIQDFALRNISAGAGVPSNIGSLANLRNVSLQFDNAGINFPTITLHNGGKLTAIAGGNILQSGVITVPGTASFDAGTNAITLTQNNIFDNFVTLKANSVALKAVSALQIASATLGSGALTLTGVGVSQSGPITQASGTAAVTINAGAGAIILKNANNIFLGAVSLNNSGAHNVQITNSGALKLGASSVGTGTLDITAGGTITESGPIIQTAGAGTVTLSVTAPNSDILLDTQANDFSGAILYGGTLSNIRDIGRRNVNANAGITATNLALLTNLHNVTIIFDNSSVLAPAVTLHDGGNLYVNTSGSLSGGTGGDIIGLEVVVVPGTSTLIAGAHSIIANQDNVLTGAVFLSNTGNNNISIKNTIALTMGTSNVGSGTLNLTGLGISQSPGSVITQEAGAGAAIFNAGSGPITLTNTGNSFTGAVSLFNSGNSPVSLINSGSLTLGTSSVGTGLLSITSGGDIDQTGAIVQAGPGAIHLASTVANTDIDLNTALNNLSGPITFDGTLANIHDFALRNISSSASLPTNLGSLTNLHDLNLQFDNAGMAFPTLTLHNGGSLTAIAGGDITQTGILTVPGTSLFNGGAHAITLDQNNSFTGAVRLVNSGNNNVSVKNAIALSLGTSSVGTGTLSLTGFEISQIGAITQAAGAGAANITAVSGPISLTNPGNNFTGAVSLTSPGAVSLIDTGTLTLGASSIGTTLSITSGGDINQTGAIIQTGVGAITLASKAAGTDIDLSTKANDLNGTISFSGTLANIQDFALRNISNSATIPTNIGSLTNLRNLNLQFDNAAINIPTLTLHNAGSLTAIAGGDITQTGILTVPGNALFNAGANAITLIQNNIFTGAVTLLNSGNNNVAIKNTIALHLGTSRVGSGTLSLTGVGVTQAGGIVQGTNASLVTINAGLGPITLNSTFNNFTGVVSLNNSGGDNVALVNSGALRIGTSVVGSGTLSLTAGGPMSQTGAITQAAGAGAVNLATTVPASDINFITAANNFTGPIMFGGTLSDIRDFSLRNTNVNAALPTNIGSLSNLRNLSLRFDNANMTFTTLTLHNGGSLSAIAGGDILQTGVLNIPGTANFNAGNNAITLTQNNIFGDAVSLTNSGNNNVTVKAISELLISAANVGSGTLSLTGVGVIQNGAITQATGGGAVTINAGTGPISLDNVGNIFRGAVSLNNSGVNDVQLTNSGALVLGSSAVGRGKLGITTGGTISQTGAIVQADNADAVTLTVTVPNSDILLASQPNDFSGAVVYGGTLSNIRDIGRRNIHLSAGITRTNLNELSNLRNATIILDNSNAITTGFTLHNGGNLYVDTSGSLSNGIGGDILSIGPGIIPGTTTLIAGAHSITATNPNNQLTGEVFLSNSGNNNIAITNSIALHMGTSNMGNGTLSLTGLGVFQSGAITQSAGAAAVTINGGTGNINLTNPNNNFTGAVSLNNTGANNVNLVNSSDLTLGTSTVGTGAMSITAGGALDQIGIINANTLVVNATGGINLALANQVDQFTATNNDLGAFRAQIQISGLGDITFNNAKDLIINSITQNSGGNVNITNTGSLITIGLIKTQGGNVSLTTLSADNITTPILTINGNIFTAGGSITANSANPQDFVNALVVNGFLNTSPGTGGKLILGGGVELNTSPIVGNDNIILQGNGQDLLLGTLNFNSATEFAVSRDLTITGVITTLAGANLSLIGDSDNNGTGGVLVTATGAINSSGNLFIKGSNLSTAAGATNPNAGVEIQQGASILAKGNLTLQGSIGDSDIQINAPITATNGVINFNPTGLGVINFAANIFGNNTINFNGPTVMIGSQIVNGGATGAINFKSSFIGANTLTVQNGTAATGDVTFNGDVTLGNLVTFAQPYKVIFKGSNNTFTDAITFNNVGGVSLGNGNDVFNFNGGVTSRASTTTTAGTINTLNNPINFGTVQLAGNTKLNAQNSNLLIGATSGPYSLNLTAVTIIPSADININGLLTFNGNTTLRNIDINAGSGVIFGPSDANKVSLTGPVSITTNNKPIIFNATINGNQNLSLNAGALGDIIFNTTIGNTTPLNSLTIENVRNLISNSLVRVVTFIQQAGSGSTDFNNEGLSTIGTATVFGNQLTGNFADKDLIINLTTGNMFGTINGLSGIDAIKAMVVLNTIIRNKIFFDGIDISTVIPFSSSKPPIPPAPPAPPVINSVFPEIGNIVFSIDYSNANKFGLTMELLDQLLYEKVKGEPSLQNIVHLDNGCVAISPDIVLCDGLW